MASLVKEAAPDEEKMAGWSRTGIRRKAAADLAGTTSGSAGGTWYFYLTGTATAVMFPYLVHNGVLSIKPLSECNQAANSS